MFWLQELIKGSYIIWLQLTATTDVTKEGLTQYWLHVIRSTHEQKETGMNISVVFTSTNNNKRESEAKQWKKVQ